MSDDQEFENALRAFKRIAAADSPIREQFVGAFCRFEKKVKADSDNNMAMALLYKEGRLENGAYLPNVSILQYMREAVELLERCPKLKQDIGYLFAPDSLQIKGILHVVELLRDDELPYQDTNPSLRKQALAAASAIEQAVKAVWDHAPAHVKGDVRNKQYEVHGYSADHEGGFQKKSGGVVLKQLSCSEGINKKNRTKTVSKIIMGSESLIPHLLETNILLKLLEIDMFGAKATPFGQTVISIINRDGSAHGFDQNALVNNGISRSLTASPNETIKQFYMKELQSKPHSINMAVTSDMVGFVEKVFVPYQCQQYPVRDVDSPPKQPRR